MDYLQNLYTNSGLKVLIIIIILDTIFGILRAIKEHKINSGIGIDGIIRKVGMCISVLFLIAIDMIVDINLIGFLPEDLRNFLNLGQVGMGSLFMILFIVFEGLSVLKNMILCKLPIPSGLQQFLEKIMKEFTGELEDND